MKERGGGGESLDPVCVCVCVLVCDGVYVMVCVCVCVCVCVMCPNDRLKVNVRPVRKLRYANYAASYLGVGVGRHS
jgi:hypothetical protein